MEPNKEEAIRAKEIAERRFTERDFSGAKHYALKAQALFPGLEGVTQMVSTFDVYAASEGSVNGEIDYYAVLGLNPTADKNKVKRQYRKMAVLLHPDKNKSLGADGAFKLVSEAWTLLSDSLKRSSYDRRRSKQLSFGTVQTNMPSMNGVGQFDHCYSPVVSHHRLDTFWTVCTSCKVQYEYLRKYLNKRLSCKNCRGVFMAVETGPAPVNGSYPYSAWSYAQSNGHGSHGINGTTNYPANSVFCVGNGVPGFHSGHSSEPVANVSFQWNSTSGSPSTTVNHSGLTKFPSSTVLKANGNVKRRKNQVISAANSNHHIEISSANMSSNVAAAGAEVLYSNFKPGAGRPDKRRKGDFVDTSRIATEETGSKAASETKLANASANVGLHSKFSSPGDLPTRRYSMPPVFDARKLLIHKAKTDIQKKLAEMKLAVASAKAASDAKSTELQTAVNGAEASEMLKSLIFDHGSVSEKPEPVSITVPDPDFHNFDKDRSEECFKAKQIWALYDEDGMPRLYCMIRQVMSLDPFKMHVTYLNSKTNSEFGTVSWVDAGFTKSCGKFKAMHSDIVDQVNIFSHVLSGEIKAGRGGCVRIYPKSGEIWAIYRNWSPEWDMSTPDEVRNQYEMVEVVDNFTEERGVSVAPLLKLDGYKTVYQRSADKNAIRWIPKREMLCFSHQVPSWLLKEEACDLPDGCWDLDPAAIPDNLLHSAKEQPAKEQESNPEEQ